MEQGHELESAPAPYDRLAADLVRLRSAAGHPSYAAIALQISRQRQHRGIPRSEAHIGRTTVYDAFRPGRRRINAELVVEIVRALGGDDADARRWAEACRAARAATEAVRPANPESAAAESPMPVRAPAPSITRMTLRRAAIVALLCLGVNLAGAELVYLLKLPLFLDMAGTALAAIVLGPWWGAGVALATNLGMAVDQGPQALPFALVNVAGALLWGYGVRRFRMGNGLPRFFALNVVVGFGCTLVAAPIVYLVFGGGTGHGSDSVTQQILGMSQHLLLAVSSANLLTSLADKLLSGFFVLVAIEAFPIALASGRDHVHLVRTAPDT